MDVLNTDRSSSASSLVSPMSSSSSSSACESKRGESKMPLTFRDSGIELDLDPGPEQPDRIDSCPATSIQKPAEEDGARSRPDPELNTRTVMTPRVVPSSESARKGASTLTDPDRRGTIERNRSKKDFLLPYRFLTPSKLSIAKKVDDLFVPENGSRENQQKRLAVQPFLLSLIRNRRASSHVPGLVHQSGNIRDCRLSIDKALVVGMTSRLTVTLPLMEIRKRTLGGATARNAGFTEIPKLEFAIAPERDPECGDSSSVIGRREVWDAVYVYEYTPSHPGSHALRVADPDGRLYEDFVLDVVGSDPVLSFNDASFWPIALTVDDSGTKRDQCIVYVAYRTHIAEFLADGRYVKQLTQLGRGSYGQLAVAPRSNVLAATVRETGGSAIRHRVHVYHSLSGRKLYDFGAETPTVGSCRRRLSVASVDDGRALLFADGRRLFQIDVQRLDVIRRLDIEQTGSVSRVCCRDDKYYLADAAGAQVKVYDSNSGECLSRIEILSDDGQPASGLVGLAVDKHGNVITCDCTTGNIRVHDKHGRTVKVIHSCWEPVRWPLDVGIEASGDTYLYVVDHGNISIKKFRYL